MGYTDAHLHAAPAGETELQRNCSNERNMPPISALFFPTIFTIFPDRLVGKPIPIQFIQLSVAAVTRGFCLSSSAAVVQFIN